MFIEYLLHAKDAMTHADNIWERDSKCGPLLMEITG